MFNWRSEYEKALDAQDSKKNKKDGFEGCSRCGDTGYYLAEYTKEGYCYSCEIVCYPERFYPCPCCRLPHKIGIGICSDCKNGMGEHFGDPHYLRNRGSSLYKEHSEWFKTAPKNTKPGDFIKSWDSETITSSNDILPAANDIHHVRKFKKSNGPPEIANAWPGFYFGNGIWKKLDYLPILDENGIVID